MRRIAIFICSGLAVLIACAAAEAVSPSLLTVSSQNRHPAATFSAPHSDFGSITIASKPDRATDGSFLSENIVGGGSLTDSELQAGSWLDSDQIDPGTYYVLLNTHHDFNLCYRDDGTFDPACADGYSDVKTLVVPQPPIHYRPDVTRYTYLKQAQLRLTATPLGVKQPYQVCYRTLQKKKRCLHGVLAGFSWDYGASDSLSVNTRNLAQTTTFTWSVAGKAVAVKRARVK